MSAIMSQIDTSSEMRPNGRSSRRTRRERRQADGGIDVNSLETVVTPFHILVRPHNDVIVRWDKNTVAC
jgi:hypothetical protein